MLRSGVRMFPDPASGTIDRFGTWWRLRRTPLARIRDLEPDRPVKVAGIARAEHAPLVAPFSGRACAIYRIVTWRRRPKRRLTEAEEYDYCFADEEHGTRFSIDDGSGVAVVEPRGWASWRVEHAVWRGAPGEQVEANLEAWRRDKPPEALEFFQGFDDEHAYVEWAVGHGEPITVLGRATETHAGEHVQSVGYRELPRGWVIASGDARLVLARGPAAGDGA